MVIIYSIFVIYSSVIYNNQDRETSWDYFVEEVLQGGVEEYKYLQINIFIGVKRWKKRQV